ncbi:MAG: PAS domain S-box protein [Acidobacteria bacterium]|nr:PAS domain S-box protein [Acidobacteriota bacterium]
MDTTASPTAALNALPASDDVDLTRDTLRILFVEDAPEFVALATRLFRSEGITSEQRCVETLPEFAAAVQEFKPHVILSDFLLPDATGTAFLDAARVQCPHTPVLIVSGGIGEDVAVDLLKRGAADYVSKTRLTTLVPRTARALREVAAARSQAALAARLHEREEFFRSLIEASPDGMLVVDDSGRIELVNGEMERMFGYSRSELTGAPFDILIPARFRRQQGGHLQRILADPGKCAVRRGMELLAMRKDGEEFQSTIALSSFGAAGRVQVVATVRDMTESVNLRAEIGRVRGQLDTMPESIVLVDQDGRITYANEAWRRNGRDGVASQEFVAAVGHSYLDEWSVAGDATAEHVVAQLSALLAGRSAGFTTVYPCHSPDELRWVKLIARPVEHTHGAAMLIHVDHTEAFLAAARSRVQHEIARCLARDVSLEDACGHLVDSVTVELEWQIGAVWVPEEDDQALRCVKLRIDRDLAGGPFEAQTRSSRFLRGLGLLGRVWETRAPEWIASVATATNVPRLAAAVQDGVRSGFAFAIHADAKVLAVIEFYASRQRACDEALLGVLGNIGTQVGDMIRRQRAEESQRLSLQETLRVRSRLETLLEAAPMFVATVDADGRVEFANRPFPGTSTAVVGGGLWVAHFPEDRREAAGAALRAVLDGGTSQLFEVPLATGAKTVWLQNHVAPIRRGTEVVGAVVMALDVSEKRQIEGDLAVAQRLAAVGSLAAGVAHEINTPIQFVGDSIHFLKDAAADVFGLLEHLREVRRGVQEGAASIAAAAAAADLEETVDLEYLQEHMPKAFDRCLDGISRVATIVRAMKEFAHPSQPDMAPVDLNRAVQSTLIVAANEYKYVAELVTDFQELPPITCHVNDVNQVILNLVVNAAHAIEDMVKGSDEKGMIRVSTRLDGDAVVIAVGDTGGGIPPAVRDRIFEPFFTTKEVGRGTGQGLAIAWTIVKDKHRGDIRCESVAGAGTTFHVRLPVAGSAVAEEAPVQAEP